MPNERLNIMHIKIEEDLFKNMKRVVVFDNNI